ncbi:hypothetical protein REPUB_Repub02eG0058200 [Reevesia pubescens]
MQDQIEQHRRKMRSARDGERKKTMIEILLLLQESESEYYIDEIIKGLMIILLMARTEASVTTMEWALSLLLNHPEVLKKAQTEIINTVGHERLIDESDLAELLYLRNIISETLRIMTPRSGRTQKRFKPEKFEGLEGARDGFKSIPFGAGRRGCPGESLGLRIVGLTLGLLLQCFDWSSVGDEMVDIKVKTGVTMSKAELLQVKFKPLSTMFGLLSQI